MDSAPDITLGTYRHSKTGNLYEVIGVALDTEAQIPLVIYKPLYDTDWQLFARPYGMFFETVLANGVSVPRFQFIDKQDR